VTKLTRARASPRYHRRRSARLILCGRWRSLFPFGHIILSHRGQESALRASTLSFRAAVLLVAAGMIWGIAMAIAGDHATMPAHAHLNLLGWVSLFLFGIFYHLHPAIDRSRLALVQAAAWIAGTVIMAVGVALVHTGRSIGEPIAALSSVLVLADMLLFGWLVFRRDHAASFAQRPLPAE
jgi:hypothetical protein